MHINGHVIGLALFIPYRIQHYTAAVRDRKAAHGRGALCQPDRNLFSRHNIANMSNNNIAPWLQGLDSGWEAPAHLRTANVSSASHDADSLRQSASRIPRRSLSGLPSSTSSKRADSTQKRRPPLAQLNSNDTNTLSRANDSVRIAGTRSVSAASEGSTSACGTVQQRSKSASPSKKQETMEWKRRLVNGNVGYGDQTDLFGANGLENIFARTNVENEHPKPKNKMSWLQKSDAPMPSSPPPWPSSIPRQRQQSAAHDFASQEISSGEQSMEQQNSDGSFRSNPFDLENTEDSQDNQRSDGSEEQDHLSSPNKAFVEVSQDTGAGNRTVSGQTQLSQEDFSPVFISKTKTLNGFDYAALDSHVVKQFNSTKVNLRHPSQEQSEESSASDPPAPEIVEQSAFTDGPESESQPTVPDISFSENLPTGSPFPNLGDNVQTRRGGYSNHGSFKQRPLSPSQSTAEPSLNPSASGLLSPIPSEKERSPAQRSPSNRPITPKQDSEAKSRSSGSPLKLFGAHDTFTNNRLLRRLSQLNPDGTVKLNAISESSPRTAQREPSRNVSNGSSFGRG